MVDEVDLLLGVVQGEVLAEVLVEVVEEEEGEGEHQVEALDEVEVVDSNHLLYLYLHRRCWISDIEI